MSVYSYKTEIIKTQTELNHENLLQLLKDTIYGMRPNILKIIQELPNQDNLNLQNLPEGYYTLVKKLLIYNETDRFEILRFIYKNNGIIHKFDYIIPSNELSNNYFESFEQLYSLPGPKLSPFLKLNKKIYDRTNKDIVFLPIDLVSNFNPTSEDEGKYFFFKYKNLRDQETIYTEVEGSLNHDYKYNPLLDDTLFCSGSITVGNLKANQNIDLNKINPLEYTLSFESDSEPNKSNKLVIYCKINDKKIFIDFPFPQTNNFVKYNPQGRIPQPNVNFFTTTSTSTITPTNVTNLSIFFVLIWFC